MDEKSYKIVLVYDMSYNTLFGLKHCVLDLMKWMDLLKFMMGLDI